MSRGLGQLGAVWVVVATLGACVEDGEEKQDVAALTRPAPRARVLSFAGEVSVKRADGDEWIPATSPMGLFDNDKLRTAPGATADLRFANGSRLTVGEDALVGIAESRPLPGKDPADVTVLKGRIDAELTDERTQSLVVTTPAATIRAGREIVFQ